MTTSPQKVLIMAGGTGGHVFPALAVAAVLKAQGAHVEWLGTAKGIEARVVPEAGFTLHTLSVVGVRGKGALGFLKAPLQITQALIQAIKIIKAFKPDCVLGFGGFASGPGGLAAWLLRIPLMIHEQNAVAGSTNRILAHLSTRVFASFPNAFKESKAEVVGNPVRAAIAALPAPELRFQGRVGPLRLLILGGSQGAAVMNTQLPQALAHLAAEHAFEILHQAGPKFLDEARLAYLNAGVPARVEGFIEDMALAYGWADWVICRAGATTVTELMAAGLTALLIPYPHATDDHQFHNANFLAQAGAGMVLRQEECTEAKLLSVLNEVAQKGRAGLLQQSVRARSLAKTQAAHIIAEACLSVKNKKGKSHD